MSVRDVYSLQFDFQDGNGFIPYPAITRNFQKTEVSHKRLKPADNSCVFEMQPEQALLNKLVGSTKEIRIYITKNGSAYFTGYVRKNFSFSKTTRLKPIKVECVDGGFLLKKKINKTFSLRGLPVSDTANKSNSFLHQILYMAGVPDAGIDIPDIAMTIPVFSNIAGEGSHTYYSLLEKVCFESKFVFYFDELGVFRLRELFPSSFTVTQSFTGGVNILNEIVQKKKEEDREAVQINYRTLKTISGATVFSDTTNGGNGNSCNIVVQPGAYMSPDQNETEWYAEYKVDDYEILSVENAALDIEKDSEISVLLFEPLYTRAKLSIKNTDTTFEHTIRKLNITGDALVKDAYNKSISGDPASDKLETYDAEFIHEKSVADSLSNGMYSYFKYSDFSYDLTSRTDYPVGSIVSIIESGLGSITARILTKKTNEQTGDIKYSLEGIGEFLPVTITHTTTGGQPKPLSPVIQDTINVVDLGLDENGNVKQPINGNTMVTDTDPVGDGLYLTKSFMGLFAGGVKKAFIGIDGIFEFNGDAEHYIKWNGVKLEIAGEMHLDGNSTISGTLGVGKTLTVDGDIILSQGALSGTGFSVGPGGVALTQGSISLGSVFSVTSAGFLTAQSGAIGGISLAENKLYLGFGTYGTSDTPFYVDSAGKFSLKDKLKWDGSALTLEAQITATGGTIADWSISTGLLKSAASGARVELNATKNRVSIFDSAGIEKTVMGYLDGLPKSDGTGNWTSSDYGFWAKPSSSLTIDGDIDFTAGDWIVNHDASISFYFQGDAGSENYLKLGSLNGAYGLHIKPDSDWSVTLSSHNNWSASVGNVGALDVKNEAGSVYVSAGEPIAGVKRAFIETNMDGVSLQGLVDVGTDLRVFRDIRLGINGGGGVEGVDTTNNKITWLKYVGTSDISGYEGTPVANISYDVTNGYFTFDKPIQASLKGNADSATNATRLQSTSHPGTYYLTNKWTGTHWLIESNHGSPVRVGYADNANNLDGHNSTYFAVAHADGYLPKSGGTLSGDLNLNNNELIFNYADSTNIDHIWHDDGSNIYHFVSDAGSRSTGNATLRVGAISFDTASVIEGDAGRVRLQSAAGYMDVGPKIGTSYVCHIDTGENYFEFGKDVYSPAFYEGEDRVVERGSNTDGDYVKYSSGTLICYGEDRGNYTNSSSNLFGTSVGTVYWRGVVKTFPHAFVNVPRVMATADYTSSDIGMIAYAAYVNYTDFTLRHGHRGYNTESFGATYMAIGRWK